MQPHLDQPLDPEAIDAADAADPPASEARPRAMGRPSPRSSRSTPAISHRPRASSGPSRSPSWTRPSSSPSRSTARPTDRRRVVERDRRRRAVEAIDTGRREAVDAVAEAPDDEHADDDAPSDEAGSAADAAAEPALPSTVAELIAATLRAAGVRIAFTVPGESFLPVLDALQAAGIRVVATRHEGGAAFAAEAYGQLTGRPAACLGTRAVGAANLAIGIHTATADSTPMFVLVGQVDRGVRGREAFQEVDLVGTIGRLAKWAGEIDDPATAAATLEAAVRATVEGRPGPALLALPEDVLHLALPEGTRAPVVRAAPRRPGGLRRAGGAALARRRGAAGHPRRRRRPARPLLQRPRAVRGAAARPGDRRLAARRRRSPTTTPSTSAWPATAARGVVARAAPDGRRAAGDRLPPERGHHRGVHAPGARPALDARRPRAAGRAPSATRRRPSWRSAPTRGRSCARPWPGSRRPC